MSAPTEFGGEPAVGDEPIGGWDINRESRQPEITVNVGADLRVRPDGPAGPPRWTCGSAPMDLRVRPEDEGEAACIRFALAHEGSTCLLMDERAGRALAVEHGLRVAGTTTVTGLL